MFPTSGGLSDLVVLGVCSWNPHPNIPSGHLEGDETAHTKCLRQFDQSGLCPLQYRCPSQASFLI